MLPLLPPERQERLLRIKQSEKRREPLCAYLILRHALWEQYRWRELPPIRAHLSGQALLPGFPGGPLQSEPHHRRGAGGPVRGAGGGGYRAHPAGERARAMRRLADVTTERAFFQSWVRRRPGAKRSGAGVGTMLGVGDPAPAWGAILFSGHLSGLCGGSGHPGRGPARPGAQILPG